MKHVIMVKLEIEAESFEDAIDAVERVLDNGDFQDAINERVGAFVRSATCDAESAFRDAVLAEGRRELYRFYRRKTELAMIDKLTRDERAELAEINRIIGEAEKA